MRDGGAGCVKAMCIGPSVRPIAPGGSHYIEALNVNKLADLKEDIWIADAANNVSFKAYDKIDINNEYV